MFNGSYEKPSTHVRTPGQEHPPSSSRRMDATNDLSSSGHGFQYNFSQALAPNVEGIQVQSAFRHPIPLLPGNSSQVHRDDQSHELGPNDAAATSSFWECGSHASTPHGQPTPMTANVHSGSIGDAGATFTEDPPTATRYLPSVQPPPGVYARPNAQGIPTPVWQLSQTWIDYEDGDDLRLIILFKKVRST